jgi:arylsulfatase A-like enzyme
MNNRTTDVARAAAAGPARSAVRIKRKKLLPFLLLCGWCGLVAGLLEVGATVARKQFFDINRLYWVSRHFVWLVPLGELMIFLGLGLLLWLLGRTLGARGRWLANRLLGVLVFLPAFWAAFPRLHGLAGIILLLGVMVRLVPAVERRGTGFRRVVLWSYPLVALAVAMCAAAVYAGDYFKGRRERARALPEPRAPNVLLIVLDTVAADHLSLYGYGRPTSPTLGELAERAIRFDRARATTSWTLQSHASMFTGRWPHEVSAGWLTPLDDAFPTLAEYLGSRGYATAGVVANYTYCASDSGLARGFTEYRDYVFPGFTALGTTALVDRPVDGLQALEHWLGDRLGLTFFRSAVQQIWRLFKGNRKPASVVNREFLHWLTARRQVERPFFAFLNYYDAHSPYQLPENGIHRFGNLPRDYRDADLLKDWTVLSRLRPSQRQVDLIRDAYDDCVADLDEQLGRLIDTLERRGILERTWLIITADHGESFGEHPGVYRHGTSLYQSEVRVPLLIVPPGGSPPARQIAETVSMRDLPATIVDFLGLQEGSPFPGSSLAELWKSSSGSPADLAAALSPALSEVVPLDGFNPDPAQVLTPRSPLAALSDQSWTFIRRDGEPREELFHWREDPNEQNNLAGAPASAGVLEGMRQALNRLTAGPLTPDRFNR